MHYEVFEGSVILVGEGPTAPGRVRGPAKEHGALEGTLNSTGRCKACSKRMEFHGRTRSDGVIKGAMASHLDWVTPKSTHDTPQSIKEHLKGRCIPRGRTWCPRGHEALWVRKNAPPRKTWHSRSVVHGVQCRTESKRFKKCARMKMISLGGIPPRLRKFGAQPRSKSD